MEAVSTTSTGHTDADEQESRAEGLSQPANACTQCVGRLNFSAVLNLYYMYVNWDHVTVLNKAWLASVSQFKGCHKCTCCMLNCDCSEILTCLKLWFLVFQLLTYDFSVLLKLLTTVYLSEHLLSFIGLHYGIILWCMIGTANKKQYEKRQNAWL